MGEAVRSDLLPAYSHSFNRSCDALPSLSGGYHDARLILPALLQDKLKCQSDKSGFITLSVLS